VQLDPVETGGNGILGRLDEILPGSGDFAEAHRLGHRVRLHARAVGIDLAGGSDGRGGQYLRALRQIVRMANTSGVHELDEDLGAAAVNRAGDALPAGHLGL